MPHKSKSRRPSAPVTPLTFSSFSRSIARIASAYMAKRQKLDKNLHESNPSTSGNGYAQHSSEEKNFQSESSEDEEFEGVVQADFAFFDPKPDDFHGVKVLLQTYLDNKEWDLSGFVDIILGQTTVGTVVKLEDDEDGLFSVVSALNLGRYKDHKSIMEIKEFLINVCKEKSVLDVLKLLLGEQAHSVGLLVSQRVVNLPPQLLPPLYDALFDEISWATEDEPTEELRKSFRFKSFLLISKIYKHKNADQKKKQTRNTEEDIVYVKLEDEIFHKLSKWSFYFPLHSEHATPHEMDYGTNSINIQDEVVEDVIIAKGLTFKTAEEIEKLYIRYANNKGFSVRRRRTRANYVQLVCNREGFHTSIKETSFAGVDGNQESCRLTKSSKIGCGASLCCALNATTNICHITKFDDTHNHDMVTPKSKKYLRSHKNMTNTARDLCEVFDS